MSGNIINEVYLKGLVRKRIKEAIGWLELVEGDNAEDAIATLMRAEEEVCDMYVYDNVNDREEWE